MFVCVCVWQRKRKRSPTDRSSASDLKHACLTASCRRRIAAAAVAAAVASAAERVGANRVFLLFSMQRGIKLIVPPPLRTNEPTAKPTQHNWNSFVDAQKFNPGRVGVGLPHLLSLRLPITTTKHTNEHTLGWHKAALQLQKHIQSQVFVWRCVPSRWVNHSTISSFSSAPLPSSAVIYVLLDVSPFRPLSLARNSRREPRLSHFLSS